MHLLWRRYSRSGYAPAWFYFLMAGGFGALVVWAAMRQDWIVALIAAAMVPVTIGGSRLMRRMAATSPDVRQSAPERKEDDHE